jgi:hypothetical protein
MCRTCGKLTGKLLKILWEECGECAGIVYKKLIRSWFCTQFGIMHRNIRKFFVFVYTWKNKVFDLLWLGFPRFPHRTITITTIYNMDSQNEDFSYMSYNFNKEELWM